MTGLGICDVYGASSSGSKSIITSSSSGPPHREPRALVMPVVALLSELARESADAPEYIEREEREEWAESADVGDASDTGDVRLRTTDVMPNASCGGDEGIPVPKPLNGPDGGCCWCSIVWIWGTCCCCCCCCANAFGAGIAGTDGMAGVASPDATGASLLDAAVETNGGCWCWCWSAVVVC